MAYINPFLTDGWFRSISGDISICYFDMLNIKFCSPLLSLRLCISPYVLQLTPNFDLIKIYYLPILKPEFILPEKLKTGS